MTIKTNLAISHRSFNKIWAKHQPQATNPNMATTTCRLLQPIGSVETNVTHPAVVPVPLNQLQTYVVFTPVIFYYFIHLTSIYRFL